MTSTRAARHGAAPSTERRAEPAAPAAGVVAGGAAGPGGPGASREAEQLGATREDPAEGAVASADRRTAAERAWGNLRALVLERNERRKEVAEALGMSFFRVKALRRVAKRPYCMGELATELATDRPYLTLVVADLEQRGLVSRKEHPTDRRSKVVSATPEGLAVAARANAILGAPPPALLALPPEDLAALDRITAALTALPHED